MDRNHAGDDAAQGEQAQAVPGHQASELPVIRQKLDLLQDTVNKAFTKAKAKAAQSHQVPEKGSSVVHLQRSAHHQQAFNGALLWNAAKENNEGLVKSLLDKGAKLEDNPGTGSQSAKDK